MRAETAALALVQTLAHLNMRARQHLRAVVNEPREIGGVVRHENDNVLRSGRRGRVRRRRVRRRRDIGRKVNVVCTHDVGVTQLAREQNLRDGQSAKSAEGGCSFTVRGCALQEGGDLAQ